MLGAPLTGPKFTTLSPTCRWRAPVAGMQHEALRRRGELRLDEVAPEAHHLGRLIHQRRRRAGIPRARRLLRISSPASSSMR